VRDPTRRLPNRLPTGDGPFVPQFLTWIGDLVRAYVPWAVYRLFMKSWALVHGYSAGECRYCRANVTWPLRGPRLSWCPACGCEEPCPPNDQSP